MLIGSCWCGYDEVATIGNCWFGDDEKAPTGNSWENNRHQMGLKEILFVVQHPRTLVEECNLIRGERTAYYY